MCGLSLLSSCLPHPTASRRAWPIRMRLTPTPAHTAHWTSRRYLRSSQGKVQAGCSWVVRVAAGWCSWVVQPGVGGRGAACLWAYCYSVVALLAFLPPCLPAVSQQA